MANTNPSFIVSVPLFYSFILLAADAPAQVQAEAILLEISNCTRFIELRRAFYAHVVATVAPPEAIEYVEWLRDGQVLQRFQPAEGDKVANGQVPVTQLRGDYAEGWIWQRRAARPVHFQADLPVTASGWYAVRIHTATGRTITSGALRFDASHPNSRAISLAHLNGAGCSLRLQGYGEEMPLGEIHLPFAGDHWWYPRNSFWRMTVDFGRGMQTLGGGWKAAQTNFKASR